MTARILLAASLALVAAPAFAAPAAPVASDKPAAAATAPAAPPAYDDSWYRTDGWSGEYPDGFSVLKDITVKLRPVLSPSAERTIDCALPTKATYHPWNSARVAEQNLDFVAFTRVQDWEITTAYDALFYSDVDGSEYTVHFAPGDRWRYLAYYAEGTFAMEFQGKPYTGDQGLIDASKQIGTTEGYEEWMRIDCPNNMWGWLYMRDMVIDDVTFGGPNIGEYGSSSDLP